LTTWTAIKDCLPEQQAQQRGEGVALIVFDLDGTLIDSAPDIHAASNRVLAAEGFAPLTFDQVRSFIGKGVPHLVERLLEASGEDPKGPRHAAMMARFVEGYETAVGLTVIYPGVVAALERLVGEGHGLGICTNKPFGPTMAVLDHLNLTRFFPVVAGGDSLAVRKPDPAPLFHVIERLGGGLAIYVGDSEVDAETAERARLPFLLYTEGYRKSPIEALPHTHAFSDWTQMPDLVRGVT
jgi:phosphoglycolate phosphatase